MFLATHPPFRPLVLATMDGMNVNPLFSDLETSPSHSSCSFSTSDNDIEDVVPIVTPSALVLQTINIMSHVPIILDLVSPNYVEWHTFDNVINKFSLRSHVFASLTST
jgi:hypothetical protein